jgi:drug/metabolite transporter (DMT)-like permease
MTRLRADLLLLLVAVIWGSAFAVQRIAAEYFDVFTFNGLRFLLAGVILLPFALWRGRPKLDRNLWLVVLAGAILFLAGGLQQAGLELTTAGNAGFITSLYVVFVPLLLRIFWKEQVGWVSWAAAGLAVLGSLLLSTAGEMRISLGDALELIGALLWALHVILVGKAVHKISVLTFSSGQYLAAGVFNLAVSLLLGKSFAGLAEGWWTIFYIGILSTTVGYTLQVLGQKYAPPTDASILLSTEAVFAALFGFLFLGETLIPVQIIGCAFILGAILLTQVKGSRL